MNRRFFLIAAAGGAISACGMFAVLVASLRGLERKIDIADAHLKKMEQQVGAYVSEPHEGEVDWGGGKYGALMSAVEGMDSRFSELQAAIRGDIRAQESRIVRSVDSAAEKSSEEVKSIKKGVFFIENEDSPAPAKDKRNVAADRDLFLRDAEETARSAFSRGDYYMAMGAARKVLEEEGGNTEMRYIRMYSNFSLNKLDSDKYGEILADCNALQAAGLYRKEIDAVVEFIKTETGR